MFMELIQTLNLTIKYTRKTILIILMCKIDRGHCQTPFLERLTFRISKLWSFSFLEQLLSRFMLNEKGITIGCTFYNRFFQDLWKKHIAPKLVKMQRSLYLAGKKTCSRFMQILVDNHHFLLKVIICAIINLR